MWILKSLSIFTQKSMQVFKVMMMISRGPFQPLPFCGSVKDEWLY